MPRVDRFIVGVCTLVAMLLVAAPVAYEAPMFSRCTQAAMDILARADAVERHPPAWLVTGVDETLTSTDLPLASARMSMWNSGCNGPRYRTVERMFERLGLSIYWRLRFSHEDVVALYVSQAWLGMRPVGFAAASRAYFGRELGALTPDQQRCLMQKLRSVNPRGVACEKRR